MYQCLERRLDKKKQQEKEYNQKLLESLQAGDSIGQAEYMSNDFLFTYENCDPIYLNSYSRAFRNIIKRHNAS